MVFVQLSYRQGMHELLAPIVAVLHRDVSACSESLASMDEADDRVAVLKMLMDHTVDVSAPAPAPAPAPAQLLV
eukprot:746911-Hanusia_phi.AAC.3